MDSVCKEITSCGLLDASVQSCLFAYHHLLVVRAPLWAESDRRRHHDQAHDPSFPLLSHHRHAKWLPTISSSGQTPRLWTSARTTRPRQRTISNSHRHNCLTRMPTGLNNKTRAINELLAPLSIPRFNPRHSTFHNQIPTGIPPVALSRCNTHHSTFLSRIITLPLRIPPIYHQAFLWIHFCNPVRSIGGEATTFLLNIRRSQTRPSRKYHPHLHYITLGDNPIVTKASRSPMSSWNLMDSNCSGAVLYTQGFLLKMGASFANSRPLSRAK